MNLTLKILLKLYFLIFLVAPLHSEEKKEVFFGGSAVVRGIGRRGRGHAAS